MSVCGCIYEYVFMDISIYVGKHVYMYISTYIHIEHTSMGICVC